METEVFLEIAFPKFSKYKERLLIILANSLVSVALYQLPTRTSLHIVFV